MEWAQPFQAAPARALELQVLADDLVDLRALSHERDVRRADPTPGWHQLLPPMTAAPAATPTAAVLRRLSTSSSQSRNTCWCRGNTSSPASVGRGDQPPVLPLSASCRPALPYRCVPLHIEAFSISTGRPSRSIVQVPFQKDRCLARSRTASSGSVIHRPVRSPLSLANTHSRSPMTAAAPSFQFEARSQATTAPSRNTGSTPFSAPAEPGLPSSSTGSPPSADPGCTGDALTGRAVQQIGSSLPEDVAE